MTVSALITSILLLFFNTKGMMPNDARLESTAAFVKDVNPDFVYMTEEYTDQMNPLMAENYPFQESATSHIDVTERFYSKYPILDVTEVGAFSSGKNLNAWVHRVRVSVGNGNTLNIYCCHLPHGYNDRISIVNAILQDISVVGGRAVVGGDMNSLAISSPIRMLGRSGLQDSWTEKGRGDGSTFHGLPLGIRIDYVFHSRDLNLQSIKRISGAGISDHDALFAEFLIN